MNRYSTKTECETAIKASGRGNTSAIWCGPSLASAQGIAAGWYAYCNNTRKYVL